MRLVGWSSDLKESALRMRCSRCGKKGRRGNGNCNAQTATSSEPAAGEWTATADWFGSPASLTSQPESPGQVHTVTNNGADVAVIWWSTIFPKSDGIVEFSPEFKAGGTYFVTAPNCED